MLRHTVLGNDKICQEGFSKIVVLKRSTKRTISISFVLKCTTKGAAPFVERPVHKFQSAKIWQKCNF